MPSTQINAIQDRVEKLRAKFDHLLIDAFRVTFQPHLHYLSCFSGSSGIGIVTSRSTCLVTDGRYASQVRIEVKGWKIFISRDSLFEEIKKRNLFVPGWRISFDGNTVAFSQYKALKGMFPKVKFLPKSECIEKIASVKDPFEIEKLTTAVGITDKVFSEVIEKIKPGVRELDISAEISFRQRRHGAEADAFEPIVASGDRSALPHGRATLRKIRKGDLVTLDFGCVYQGYHSDMTRTIFVGRPHPDARKIYGVVLDAQQRAIEAAKSGMKAKDLDAVARERIKSCGYGKFYNHSLGHGLGLQIHEPPRISAQSTAEMESGNVVTIEPGVYVPGFAGVRVEDAVVVTNGRCDVLTRSPKDILVL